MALRVRTRGKAGKTRRRKSKSCVPGGDASSLIELRKQLRERTHQLAEARRSLSESLEQQTATSEVLKVISSSSGELKPVFDAIVVNAIGLCEGNFGSMLLREGDTLHPAARYNQPPRLIDALSKLGTGVYRADRVTTVAIAMKTK